MALGVGGAAAAGLESGFGMGLRADEAKRKTEQDEITNTRNARLDADREQQTLRTNARQDKTDARQDKTDAEHDDDRALAGVESNLSDARFQLGALHQRYPDGKDIPDSEAKPLYEAVGKHYAAKQQIIAKRYQPVIDQTTQKWRDFSSQAEVGKADPSSLRGQDLRDFIKATTGHDLSEYANGNIGGAISDAEAGLSTRNTSMAVRAAGTLLAPQVKQGLGAIAPDGSQIVDKDLYALLPAPRMGPTPAQTAMQVNPVRGLTAALSAATDPNPPQPQQGDQPSDQPPDQPGGSGTITPHEDPGLLMPVLQVTTRQPDGTLTQYHAPVTTDRGTGADGKVAGPLKMSDLVDRMGRLGVVDKWLKTPEMADAVKEALADKSPTNFDQAWAMVHGDPKALSDVSKDPTSLKIAAIQKFAKASNITFDEAMQKVFPKNSTGVQAKLDAIEASGMTDAEKATATKNALGAERLATPKAAGSGEGGAGLAENNNMTARYGKDAAYTTQVNYWADVLAKGGSLPARFAQSGVGKDMYGDIMKIVPARSEGATGMLANQAQFTGDKAAARTAGVKGANVELAAGEFSPLAKLAVETSAGVSRTTWQPVNKAIRAFNNGTGSPEQGRFAAANLALINTYARAISPTGVPTVHDKQHAEEVLSTADSPERYAAVVDQMNKEVAAALSSPKAVRGALRERMTNTGTGVIGGVSGEKPVGMAFNTEAAATAAFNAGRLKYGDAIIINGVKGKWSKPKE